MFQHWANYWRQIEGPEAHKAIKAADWEALLIIFIRYQVRSVLEFGSGLSTLLFSRLGLSVTSFETDQCFIDRVAKIARDVNFVHWNNFESPCNLGRYDFALVDGIMPRAPQVKLALKHARIIAIHDPNQSGRDAIRLLSYLPRIDQPSHLMEVFMNAELQ